MKSQNVLMVLIVFAALNLTHCVSFTTFQTPEVMEKGEAKAGVGVSGYGSGGIGVIDIYGRWGLGGQTDLGLKIAGIPPFFLLKGDVKYQFIEDPLNMSASMGVSYMGLDGNSTYGFYPMVLAGGQHFYGGLKGIFFSGRFSLEDEDGDTTFSTDFATEKPLLGAVLGARFGKKLQVLPELNFYGGSDTDFMLVYGVGLQFNL
jgi:hypothetical protein